MRSWLLRVHPVISHHRVEYGMEPLLLALLREVDPGEDFDVVGDEDAVILQHPLDV
jgi:hypothetical protein